HQLIRLDREVVEAIPLKLKDVLLKTVERLIHTIDAVVLEDYNKGVLIPEMVRELIAMCSNKGIPVAVDPKIRNFFSFRGCTLFKPNRFETSRALSMDIDNADRAREAGRILLDKLGSSAVLITLGEQGSVLCRSNAEPFYRPAVARHVYDVSGAGDTVIAVMALALASGLDLAEGVRVSNFAAAATCSEPGVYAVEPSDIIREVNRYTGRENIES
ncbi:MAG: D-glycero-beta-D-manno-heptose-7-phosphate kinase, partial [Candidatus Aegiribacteria sp.]|nr:D-glycero-beta-D-manno-heptose-7-phosphate kinase [Candidatus Aegiribacteria sp.]MBD3293995.1 D-glycero-beta-D-manno-heptose-7-phosphate kinase [Candidatus Fermentibacteria bacterium]